MGNDSGDSHDALLARLDERSLNTSEKVSEFVKKASDTYVTKEELKAISDKLDFVVRALWTMLVTPIVLGVIAGIMKLVLK